MGVISTLLRAINALDVEEAGMTGKLSLLSISSFLTDWPTLRSVPIFGGTVIVSLD